LKVDFYGRKLDLKEKEAFSPFLHQYIRVLYHTKAAMSKRKALSGPAAAAQRISLPGAFEDSGTRDLYFLLFFTKNFTVLR
jgi:hypothetical protein